MGARLVYGEEQRLLPWAAERSGARGFRRDAYTIGLERDGALTGVVVFDTFASCDCHVHVASDGSGHWISKELLLAACAYPFVQLGLRRVTAPIAAKNARALRFGHHIGFRPEGYHPHAANGDDLVTLGLLRENCRFITKEQRQ